MLPSIIDTMAWETKSEFEIIEYEVNKWCLCFPRPCGRTSHFL